VKLSFKKILFTQIMLMPGVIISLKQHFIPLTFSLDILTVSERHFSVFFPLPVGQQMLEKCLKKQLSLSGRDHTFRSSLLLLPVESLAG
jgi:hypothetical protein